MPISHDKLSNLIKEAFPDAEFELVDLVGDQDHYELQIKTSKFKGLSKVAQHRLVYNALSEYVGEKLHAISIKTLG